MFSFLPPFKSVEVRGFLDSIPQVYELFHSVVNSPAYRSYGEQRQRETHCIFHYTVRGQGEVLLRGNSYRTRPGEGFFNIINEPGSGYRYPADGTEDWEFVVLCFHGGNVRQIVGDCLQKSPLYRVADEHAFAAICRQLLNEPTQELVMSFLTRLLFLLEDFQPVPQDLCERFRTYVKQHVDRNPTVSLSSDALGVSREHLQRVFMNGTGTTPAEYQRVQRFERLCFLLSTDLTLEGIAEQMNFPSVSGMCIFFKRHAGMTIGEYRRKRFLFL